MKKTIKKFIYLSIAVMLAVISMGCASETERVSGAAVDLQARLFADSDNNKNSKETEEPPYFPAAGTVRFEPERETEPPPDDNQTDDKTAEWEEPQEWQETTEMIPEPEEVTEVTAIPDEPEAAELTNGVSGNTLEGLFVVTPSGRRYHVEGCRTARNIKEYLTREEAVSQGYDPCRICNP